MQTYEGSENYIFVSYSHKERAIVLPIIEGLDKAGYRVWYDAGIEAGSEWPENVATHISKSAVVLVFLSKNALNSQNCIREIHFAIKKRKEVLVVYLEELELSDGMDMQLSPLQAMFYYRFPSLQEFMQKLTTAKILSDCKAKKTNATSPLSATNKISSPSSLQPLKIAPQTSTLSKSKAIALCTAHQIPLNATVTFASTNRSIKIYWANPDISVLTKNWSLLLNDKIDRKLHVFNIPAGTIQAKQLRTRADRPQLIDLQIIYGNKDFQDIRSKFKFIPFYVRTLSY